jgi:hypothetical protein
MLRFIIPVVLLSLMVADEADPDPPPVVEGRRTGAECLGYCPSSNGGMIALINEITCQ